MDPSELERLEKQWQQVGTLKLSAAIRIGARMTRPTKDIGIQAWTHESDGECFACVYGAAWVGCGRDPERIRFEPLTDWAQKKFGTPKWAIYRVHVMYEWEGKTRNECADWLEAKGL